MEIPYAVKPRPDTGLYNAKVGIWLFLASEVMLFGALFSSYILLRVGAAPGTWPIHWLNVLLGMTNTIVLIASSVTVVLAWASLKMGNFRRYQMFQSITLLCALMFMGIKSFEYRDKFHHYEFQLKDGRIFDGHLNREETEKTGVNVPWWIPFKLSDPTGKGEIFIEHAHIVKNHADLMEGPAPLSKEAKEAEELPEGHFAASEVQAFSNYGPWHNTYTAIYFTLTGLHALHVVGGALVIFMIWGPLASVWRKDPVQYTNRVEVSGLFWHLVDLVWIFLFPVLYLL
ncbi:MAG: cytochrome c oxidase subunit 3 [Limisphaerales bacterium]